MLVLVLSEFAEPMAEDGGVCDLKLSDVEDGVRKDMVAVRVKVKVGARATPRLTPWVSDCTLWEPGSTMSHKNKSVSVHCSSCSAPNWILGVFDFEDDGGLGVPFSKPAAIRVDC